MFNTLIRSISKQFDRESNQDTPQGSSQHESDRTDDGFLLVGDTASERTTVRTDCFPADQIDAPPSYGEVRGGERLPSYTEYRSNTHQFSSPTIDVSRHPHIPHGNPMQTNTQPITTGVPISIESVENHSTGSYTSRTAISDIPFDLGCSFGGNLVLKDIRRSNLLLNRTFDISKYEYDFTTELTFLREHEVFDEDDRMDISS